MTKKHDIIWLDTTDSTNEESRRHISDLDNLSVVSAYRQEAGRGQRGNTWSSSPGENLTFSIIMKYGHEVGMNSPLRAGDQFAVSEIAALAVVDLLASHDIQAQIKWPNDIYVADRKICGILIENSVRDGFMSSSIIGIGLNVNQTDFDPLLPNPTSMALCRPSFDQPGESEPWHPLPLEPLLEEFMDIFKGYCSRYLNITGGLTRLRRLYLSQMWRKDIEADYMDISEARSFKGIIKGLTDIGLLIVEDIEKGELREFAFKEIGYMI